MACGGQGGHLEGFTMFLVLRFVTTADLYSIHTDLHVWTYSSMLRIPPNLFFFFCVTFLFKGQTSIFKAMRMNAFRSDGGHMVSQWNIRSEWTCWKI